MSGSRRMSDLIGVISGLQRVASSIQRTQSQAINVYWQNSTLNMIPAKVSEKVEMTVSSAVVKQAQLQVRIYLY